MESQKTSESESGESFSDGLAVYEIEIDKQSGFVVQYVTDKSMDNFVLDEESTSMAMSISNTSKDGLDPDATQGSTKSDVLDDANDSSAANAVFSLYKDIGDVTPPSLYTDDMNVTITPCKLTDVQHDIITKSLSAIQKIELPPVRSEEEPEQRDIRLDLPLMSTGPSKNNSLPLLNLSQSPTKINMVPSILNRSKILLKSANLTFDTALNSPTLEGDGNTTDPNSHSPSGTKESPTQKTFVLGKEQAKKRLQAFSMARQSLNISPLAKKFKPTKVRDETSENSDQADDKVQRLRAKKAMLPDQKAKAVIEEIEEIKKVETAYQEALAEGLFNKSNIKDRRSRRPSVHERSRSRERSPSKDRNRSGDRSRNKRYNNTNLKRRRPERNKPHFRNRTRSSTPPVKPSVPYPNNWNDVNKSRLNLYEIRQLKLNENFNQSFLNYRRNVLNLILFDDPSLPKHDLIVKGLHGNTKTCPQEYLNYTVCTPSVSFCENTMNAKNLYFHKDRMLKEVSTDRLERMNAIMKPTRLRNQVLKIETTRKWFSQNEYLHESEADAECHVLENDIGIGLSILKCYAEDDEDDDEEKTKETNEIIDDAMHDVAGKQSEEERSRKRKKKSAEKKMKKKDKKKKQKKSDKVKKSRTKENENESVAEQQNDKFNTAKAKNVEFTSVSKTRSKSKSLSVEKKTAVQCYVAKTTKSEKNERRLRRKQEEEIRTIKKVVEIAKDILGKHYDKDEIQNELVVSQSRKAVEPIEKLSNKIKQTVVLKENEIVLRKPKHEIIPASDFETNAMIEDLQKEDNKEDDGTPKTEEYHSNWEGDDEMMFETEDDRNLSHDNKQLQHTNWESDEDQIHRRQHKGNDDRRNKKEEDNRVRENRRSIDMDFTLYCNPHREDKWDNGGRKQSSPGKKLPRGKDLNDSKYEETRRNSEKTHSPPHRKDRKSDTKVHRRSSNEKKGSRETSLDKQHREDRFNWEEDVITEKRRCDREEALRNDKHWDKDDRGFGKKKSGLISKFEEYYNDWENEDQFEIESKNQWNYKFKTDIKLSPHIDMKNFKIRESCDSNKFVKVDGSKKVKDEVTDKERKVTSRNFEGNVAEIRSTSAPKIVIKLEHNLTEEKIVNKSTNDFNLVDVTPTLEQVPATCSLSTPLISKMEPCSNKLDSEYEEFMKAVSGEVKYLDILDKHDKLEKVKTLDVNDKTIVKQKKIPKKDVSSSSSSSSYSSDSASDSSSDESSYSSSSESVVEEPIKKSKKSEQVKTPSRRDWHNEFTLEPPDYSIESIEFSSLVPSNIPLPEPLLLNFVLKEEETQSPESSTALSTTPSPKKSRPLIPIKFLTAASRKQAAVTPTTKQTNTGFGVFDTKDVLPADSPKVTSTNLSPKVAKPEDEVKSEQLLNRNRHFSWAAASVETKKQRLETEDEEPEEDFTDKLIKKVDGVVKAPLIDEDSSIKTPLLDEERKVEEPSIPIKPDVRLQERHEDSVEKKVDVVDKKPSHRDSAERLRHDDRSKRSLSNDRKTRRSVERTRRRYSRERFSGNNRRRSRSPYFERGGRNRGRRTVRRERSRERDRRRDRSRSRSVDRRNDRRSIRRKSSRSPDNDRRNLSPLPLRSHEGIDYNAAYMDIVKSPVNSPLDGFKRSLADSTISDSDLLLQRHNSDEYNETSPRYGSNNAQYYSHIHAQIQNSQAALPSAVESPSSPKRISLDDRINQVLGIEKEQPKQISTVYSHGGQQYNNYAANYYEQYGGQYSGSYDQYGTPKPATHYPPPPYTATYPPPTASAAYGHIPSAKVVQVGNVLQVVPTEGIISSLPPPPPPVHVSRMPVNASPIVVNKSVADCPPKVVQVGNMLQIVPQPLPMEKIIQLPGTLFATSVTPNPVTIPAIPAAAAAAAAVVVAAATESPVIIQHKNSEQLVAERRAEREKRRVEREKRRKEKEKKRKEKDKRKQFKIKLKTENMIKRALLLETEGAMALSEPSDPELIDPEEDSPIIASWPPPPIILPSVNLRPAGKGILVNHDFSSEDIRFKTDERKSVKFADGICPGEGTSPSGGEDLPSPPPPPAKKAPKEKRYKKIKPKIPKLKKKRIKVKIIRTQPQAEEDSEEDNLPPPSPPPGSPPPHLFPPRVKTHTINNINPNHQPDIPLQSQMPQFQYHQPAFPPVMMYTGPHGPSHAPHGPSPPQGYAGIVHGQSYQIHSHNPQHGLLQTQHPPALPPQGAHLNRNY